MVNVGGRGSGGGLLLGRLNGLTVAEADARDHLREPLGAVQPAPVALGALGELEDHRQRGLARQAALRPVRPQPHRGEGALDRVRRPHMLPVLGRRRVEGEQRLPVLGPGTRPLCRTWARTWRRSGRGRPPPPSGSRPRRWRAGPAWPYLAKTAAAC